MHRGDLRARDSLCYRMIIIIMIIIIISIAITTTSTLYSITIVMTSTVARIVIVMCILRSQSGEAGPDSDELSIAALPPDDT